MWGRSRFARSLMINPDSGGRLRSNRCWHSCMQHGCAAALTDYIRIDSDAPWKLWWLWLLSAGMNVLMNWKQRLQVARDV